MIKKALFTVLASVFLMSCSSDSNSTTANDPDTMAYVMNVKIDGNDYSIEPQAGGNLSISSGGIFGDTYHLLEGYKHENAARFPMPAKTEYVKLAIPKTNISVGTHFFSDTIQTDEYYADYDISVDSDAGEDEKTISGKIVVVSYDATTRKIQGTFDFKTSNGITTDVTHTLSGEFNYVLAP